MRACPSHLNTSTLRFSIRATSGRLRRLAWAIESGTKASRVKVRDRVRDRVRVRIRDRVRVSIRVRTHRLPGVTATAIDGRVSIPWKMIVRNVPPSQHQRQQLAGPSSWGMGVRR
jgi:hypothetical protein